MFVCNVATQDGETAGFDLAAHVEALIAHTAPGLVDIVLANNRLRRPGIAGRLARRAGPPALAAADLTPVPRLVLDDVVDPDNAHHHDPARLAAAVMRAFERETRAAVVEPVGRTA